MLKTIGKTLVLNLSFRNELTSSLGDWVSELTFNVPHSTINRKSFRERSSQLVSCLVLRWEAPLLHRDRGNMKWNNDSCKLREKINVTCGWLASLQTWVSGVFDIQLRYCAVVVERKTGIFWFVDGWLQLDIHWRLVFLSTNRILRRWEILSCTYTGCANKKQSHRKKFCISATGV